LSGYEKEVAIAGLTSIAVTALVFHQDGYIVTTVVSAITALLGIDVVQRLRQST
jgi:hypothetical protein